MSPTDTPGAGQTGQVLPDSSVDALPGPTDASPAAGGPTGPGATDAAPAGPTNSALPGSTSSPIPGIASGILALPADPLAVSPDLDESRTVEALMAVEGGTISTTGADGTVYTLEIPSTALLNETTISLTPVASLADLPFGSEQTYAVQMRPEGLFLQDPAILTITPVDPIPLQEQILFGYQAAGDDLILAAPVLDSQEIKIQVQHFSGTGVTRGLLADIEPWRERLGGAAERRLESAVSEALSRLRSGQDQGSFEDIFTDALRQYEEQVIRPRVAAAGESCAAGRLALETVLGFERQRQLLGMSDGGNPLEDHAGLMDTAARVCVLEEFELCVEENVIQRMIPTWLGFARQYALLGIEESPVLREARDLTATCLTFRLEFESTGTLTAGSGGYSSTVTAEVMLRFDPDDLLISGEAPLVNEEFEWFAPCGATSVRGGGGPFKGFSLRYVEAPGSSAEYDSGPEALGHVLDFEFFYLPGNTSESATTRVCGSTGSTPIPSFPAWTSTFLATHSDEVFTGGSLSDAGYRSSDWEILGEDYFAKKEWIKEAGEVVEAGTFKLYHAPGG